jgi:hypothetical protein
VPSKKTPTGPREGDQYGFDLSVSRGRTMREKMRQAEETADDKGALKQLGSVVPLPKLSPIKKRLLEGSLEIRSEEPDDLAFSHSIFCQCAMPAAKPDPGVLEWERKQGKATLLIQAGKVQHPKTREWEQMHLPYGPKARLLLLHLNSEAIRNQSPIIPVEDSMTAFFRRLMGNKTQDGRQVKMLKTQLSALAAANFRIGIAYDDHHSTQINANVVSTFDLWFEKDETQRVLWPSTLRLSLDYFDSLTRHAVPLDERAIAILAFSAVALDIYCWLAQRLHRIPAGKTQFIHWPGLQEQFGQEYAEIRFFRRFFKKMLLQVQKAYPEANIDLDRKGMYLRQSPPPVRKALVVLPSTKFLELKAEK